MVSLTRSNTPSSSGLKFFECNVSPVVFAIAVIRRDNLPLYKVRVPSLLSVHITCPGKRFIKVRPAFAQSCPTMPRIFPCFLYRLVKAMIAGCSLRNSDQNAAQIKLRQTFCNMGSKGDCRSGTQSRNPHMVPDHSVFPKDTAFRLPTVADDQKYLSELPALTHVHSENVRKSFRTLHWATLNSHGRFHMPQFTTAPIAVHLSSD